MLPEAKEAMVASLNSDFANPSANHFLAESAKEKIEKIRKDIAESIGALSSEIIFTSGATESNNLIIKAIVGKHLLAGRRPHIVTSKIEHKCILAICAHLEAKGCEVTYISPEVDGSISLESLQSAIKENTVLVSLMHVNNELGTINAIRDFGRLCFERGINFHTDAAQSFQKVPINVDDDFIDALSLSAHKIGGPKGIGVAFIRDLRELEIDPVIHGAGQEFGLRGGTLATPLIAGLGSAVESFNDKFQKAQFANFKELLLEDLSSRNIRYTVNGTATTLDSCMSLTLHNVDVGGLLRTTVNEFCLSQSSACSSGSIEPSHVLLALGFSREQAEKTLRLSFSFDTQESHIYRLSQSIERFIVDR